ncbi:hypothetical protein D1BOALGB6SA_1412 [Olavius sp. associated proteobacterium Delta 1]|nr:hypothetical protein D1BOALGB6SA_1412 [Olavius sp. associated proteobacterium Delta 1]
MRHPSSAADEFTIFNFRFSAFGGSGLGVMQVQKGKLDYPYLQRGACRTGVAAPLKQAITDAGEQRVDSSISRF